MLRTIDDLALEKPRGSITGIELCQFRPPEGAADHKHQDREVMHYILTASLYHAVDHINYSAAARSLKQLLLADYPLRRR